MKLNIEKWLEKKHFADSATQLFMESIRCYKAGAYRASLLFSYLAYMELNKNRLLKSKLPNGIPQKLWDTILLNLQNEETWDKTTFEATQRKKPASIFTINDSLRREIIYWKDKRNECAHFRNVIISSHHIESFWDFTITTVPKMTVIGGKNSLLQKFYNHFNISLTPIGVDYTELIKEIEFSVDETELYDFFFQISKNLEGASFQKKTYIEIFEKIIALYNNIVSDKLIDFLLRNSSLLIEFLRDNPNYTLSFNLKPEAVRKLWFDYLFKMGNNDFPLYTTLLKNNLISNEEYNEAHSRIIPNISNYELKSEEIQILVTTNFFKVFHENHVYHGPYFKNQMADSYSTVIVEYIKLYGITDKLATCLSKTLNSNRPPYSLMKKITELFKNEISIQDQFIQKCTKIKLDIPQNILTIKELL